MSTRSRVVAPMNAFALLLALLLAPAGSDWKAPAEYSHVVPRLGGRTKQVFTNLRYEGNNRALRSAFEEGAPQCADAERTRSGST